MTPAWAAAVEAMRREPEAEGCSCEYDSLPCNPCFIAMLRAALPHALAAVVRGMGGGDLGRVWAMGAGYWHSTRDMPKPVIGPATGAATGMCFPDQMRAALLSALTDAAGRVG